MQVAVQMEFKVDRRELLGALIRRVAEQFRQVAVEPNIVASFADGPSGITTSAVDRALKKYLHLTPLQRDDAPLAGMPSVRRLTNRDESHAFAIEDACSGWLTVYPGHCPSTRSQCSSVMRTSVTPCTMHRGLRLR